MHPSVHCSTIYNSQGVERTLRPTNRWIDKEDVAYIYNEILHSHGKGWKNAIGSNMDGQRDHPTKWGKSERERHTSCDIASMWNLKKW